MGLSNNGPEGWEVNMIKMMMFKMTFFSVISFFYLICNGFAVGLENG